MLDRKKAWWEKGPEEAGIEAKIATISPRKAPRIQFSERGQQMGYPPLFADVAVKKSELRNLVQFDREKKPIPDPTEKTIPVLGEIEIPTEVRDVSGWLWERYKMSDKQFTLFILGVGYFLAKL